MCLVTFDHEALGHGSACLLAHGRIRMLTSSVFHCDAKSDWIDPAGPAMNALIGAVALAFAHLVARQRARLRFFLLLVTAFSWFWETIYLAHAMLRRDGDLYFFARFLSGNVGAGERVALGVLGLALYLLVAKLISGELSRLWPQARTARSAARTAWLWATLAAAGAALPFWWRDWPEVRDAVLEIGGASLPLLLIPRQGPDGPGTPPGVVIGPSPVVMILAVAVYVAFVCGLGRGLAI